MIAGRRESGTPVKVAGSDGSAGFSRAIFQELWRKRRVSVGGRAPPAISLAPLPDTLATRAPQVGAFEVAMIEKQVVLVDPQTRQVAAVIREES